MVIFAARFSRLEEHADPSPATRIGMFFEPRAASRELRLRAARSEWRAAAKASRDYFTGVGAVSVRLCFVSALPSVAARVKIAFASAMAFGT
jgi:hypothetical protein